MILNWLKTFRRNDPLRKVCNVRQMNRIANILNNIEGVGCRVIKPTDAEGRNWKIIFNGSDLDIPPPGDGDSSSFDMTTRAFGYALSSASVTIYPGSIRIHGIGQWTTSETDVSLSGATIWIYLRHRKSDHQTDILSIATEPESTSSEYRIPLYRFTSADYGTTYTLALDCWTGDLNFGTMI